MLQNKGLLHSDPFTFHSDGEPTTRESLILKGYWLWQVTAYALYALLGFNGIFLLSFLTIGGTATALAWQMYRSKISFAVAIPLLTVTFVLLRHFPLERPQVISFLFVTLLSGVLLKAQRCGKIGWALPLMMCLWANLHGGFVVGVIMLCCFATGVVIQYRGDAARMKNLLFWIAAGIAASLLNPNGGLVFAELFSFVGKSIQTNIQEYKSTWAAFNDGTSAVAILWLLMVLYAVGTWLRRRVYWPELLTAVFLAYFSVRYMRSAVFFPLVMLPAIGVAWEEFFRHRQWQLSTRAGLIPIGGSLLLLLWLGVGEGKQRSFEVKVAPIYPEAGIDFLRKSGLQGRMFNSYEYGGYLLWRLAPDIQIFIDGRGLSEDVFSVYEKISRASLSKVNARPEYEEILERYQIDYVIQPIYDGYGNVQPLMKVLLQKAEWAPIFLDTQVYILAKTSPGTREAIETYALDREEFKTRLLLIYDYLHRSNPQEIAYRVARAGMLLYLSRYRDAKTEIDAIALMAPHEKSLPGLRNDLQLLAGRLGQQQGL